jgi:hypothetical protein
VSEKKNPYPLRLRRKHGEGERPEATADDGARLVRAQSLRNALVAGLVTIIVFCLLGFAIQKAGRGVDWRFPALAALLAFVGSVGGNIVLAASTTAAEYGTGTLEILRAVTSMTWPVFFAEVWNVADGFFAVVAAAFAAFLAPRRLSRTQRFALRLWQQQQSDRHQ